MIRFPRSLEEVVASPGEIRAGGTDVQSRRIRGVSEGEIVDLRDVPGLDQIEWLDGDDSEDAEPGTAPAVRIGAMVVGSRAASDERIQSVFPTLAAASAGAVPHIGRTATFGGMLFQRVRCWYFRSPEFQCIKRGGGLCLARTGDHLFHSCFDLGPCVCPHPSTMALALLAYEATVEFFGGETLSMEEMLGDGSDPTRENGVEPGSVMTSVVVPAPMPGERSTYVRAMNRAAAEWALAEVVARVVVEDTISFARVAVGSVANIPLRLRKVEEALIGQRPTPEVLEAAAALAVADANPLPQTGYKLEILQGSVLEALERTSAGGAS